jgi:phospholipid-binding lipoprotein MlaA
MAYGAITRIPLARRTLLLACLVVGVATVRAAAATEAPDPLFDDDAAASEPAGFPDPLEPVNRVTFQVNQQIDRWFFEPITRAYRWAVPAPARRAVRRALVNLDAPVTFVNDVLQLEPRDAAVTAARFVVNSTVGIAGLFDVAATYANLPGHESDFGQTLALAGVPSGPYLVLPVLGPNTTRDTAGYAVDFLFRPTTYLITPGGQVLLSGFINPGNDLLLTTLLESSTEIAEGFTTREAAGEGLKALEASSVDFYASLKNAYYQNRTAMIWRRGPDHGPLARAKQALAALSGATSRGQVGDLGADRGHEPFEAVALKR